MPVRHKEVHAELLFLTTTVRSTPPGHTAAVHRKTTRVLLRVRQIRRHGLRPNRLIRRQEVRVAPRVTQEVRQQLRARPEVHLQRQGPLEVLQPLQVQRQPRGVLRKVHHLQTNQRAR